MSGLKFIASAVNNGAGSALLQMDESYFINEEVPVFEFVRDYYRSYREVPTPAIITEQTGVRMPRAEGALSYHTDNLYDRYDFEVLREGYAEFRDLMKDGSPRPVIEVMENTIRRVRRTRRGASLIDIHQGMGLVIDRLQQAATMGGVSGVPSPWPKFNEQTGGYQAADLITYVGRMSMGKTAMLLAQAEHAYDSGYSVLLVTTEMGSEQIARRWMALKFGLSPDALKKGTVSTHLLRRMRSMQNELLGRERFRLLSVGTGAKLSAVEAAVEEMCPDIVFIDGIYLFYPNRTSTYMKQTERVTAVFDELKQQTLDTNLPHVVSTQFNRTAGKGGKDGTLETIGLSDAIGWHSSLVVAVKAGPTEDPRQSRELEFLKGREGEEGKIAINFKFKPVNFTQMTPEELEMCSTAQMINSDPDWS